MTLVISHRVVTPAMDAGGLHGALVDVLLAVATIEARVLAVTSIVVNKIRANTRVLTWAASTVIIVYLTMLANITRLANAIIALEK